MGKSIFAFVILWVVVATAIPLLWKQSSEERWSLVKNVAYGLFTSAIVIALMCALVILF